jgi:hypothetical protein
MRDENSMIGYEKPAIRELGSLRELTEACQGTGNEDGADKGADPFIHSQPDFGDPGFCGGP